jgi:hypothetical protein
MFFTSFLCSVSANSEVHGVKMQNYIGGLVLLWALDFDTFNLHLVSGRHRLKLQ